MTSQAGLWSADRHMAAGERKLLVILQRERETLYALTVENQLGIFTLLQLVQENNLGGRKLPAKALLVLTV